jgi:hypothetical protein
MYDKCTYPIRVIIPDDRRKKKNEAEIKKISEDERTLYRSAAGFRGDRYEGGGDIMMYMTNLP